MTHRGSPLQAWAVGTRRTAIVALLAAALAVPAWALDVAPLWDFGNPASSEQRFTDALKTAQGDDALVLRTQIARTWGLRKDFERCRDLLRQMEPSLAGAGAEPRVRHALETGRCWISATHAPALRTEPARGAAREAYGRAVVLAREAKLDDLVVDALHMMGFVDEAPQDQLRWSQQALDLAQSSTQPAARAWRASLLHNIGMAQKQQGRLDDALASFSAAVKLREAAGQAERAHVAHWMVAWTLRAMGRVDEALAIQHGLAARAEAAGRPDPHVFDELALLYRARGLDDRADEYVTRARAARGG
ncbi:MAG: hypothetical protein ACKVQR_17850 [Aquabacterium sp.]